MAEITGDEEFERSSKEGPDDIKNLAKSTAELISSTMGAAWLVNRRQGWFARELPESQRR